MYNIDKYVLEGAEIPRGVLLYGPPGTGKTSLAKALAGECEALFLNTTGASIRNARDPVQEIKDLFKIAYANTPAILFIDEIDVIAKERTGRDTMLEMMVNTLLTEMEGFNDKDPFKPVFVVGATNYNVARRSGDPYEVVIDPALVRRFDNPVYVGLPSREERKKYIQLLLEKENYTDKISEVAVDYVAEHTGGKSLAFLKRAISNMTNVAIDMQKEISDDLLTDTLETQLYGEKVGNREIVDSIKMKQRQKQFEQLYHTVEELGGTVYEIAQDSGFLSAYEYMLKWTDSEDETENITSDDVTLITECYVYAQGYDKTERIFVFSKDEEETFLRSIGTQKDGRFLVPVHALKELEKAGYLCLNDRTPLSAWMSNYTFWGDGWNRALYVETPLEDVYVMPDIYAVQQAVRIYYAECLIRKNMNPHFFAERINAADEALLSNIETLIPKVFPEHWFVGYKEKTMPSSYQKLVYQICYIRYYYEDIYHQVWTGTFSADGGAALVSEDEPLRKGIHAVAEAFDAKDEYCLKEGERVLVFCLNDADFDAGFVEKRDGKLICLTDMYKIDLKECMEEADRRLKEKMREVVDFEQLNALGICEEDEKNKKAFEEFYGTLERVKHQFIRNDEAVVVFKNLWMEKSASMPREEYRECMFPFYQVLTKKVQEMQETCSADGFSKVYLAGNKSDDISLWEYLEEQYRAEICILMQ